MDRSGGWYNATVREGPVEIAGSAGGLSAYLAQHRRAEPLGQGAAKPRPGLIRQTASLKSIMV